MHYDNLWKTGAATTRRVSTKSPFNLLIDIIDGDPTADNKRLFNAWFAAVKQDEEYLEAVAWHTFANLIAALENRKRKQAVPKTQTVAQQRAEINALMSKLTDIVLMDLQLPNGKVLREATFAECSAAGGWFKMLAAKGKPSEVVGEVLTEQDLKEIGN